MEKLKNYVVYWTETKDLRLWVKARDEAHAEEVLLLHSSEMGLSMNTKSGMNCGMYSKWSLICQNQENRLNCFQIF